MRRNRRQPRLVDEIDWPGTMSEATPGQYNPTSGFAPAIGHNRPNTVATYSNAASSQAYGYTGQNYPSTNQQSNVASSAPPSEVVYGGYASASGGSNSATGVANSTRGRFISVTDGDHISTPDRSAAVLGNANAVAGDDRENIMRERQRELDTRMRYVQNEMSTLTADLTGQKPARKKSVRNRGPNGTETEEEMTMNEMREQLRAMSSQISYLRSQQQSPWALGLSDDPPPGYEPVSSSPPPPRPLPPIRP